MKNTGFCLRSPSGKLVIDTFDTLKDECWVKSFALLYHKQWMQPFYKKWDASIAAARKRGWEIVVVEVSEAKR